MTSPVEDRLRAAFAARAALVTSRDLRRAAPPRGRRWGTRRVRALAFTALGAAAAVAAVCVLVLLPDGPVAPDPVLPARTPVHTDAPPVPTPAPEVPVVPSVSAPRPVESP
ncbi:hypothetical protein ACIGN6_24210 [Streptomyces sp. NPDC053792]|uniref:hypothetical protein n=1 Tax=Streptomyces sp. NPDC053792 TaxID=3365716 RepID=UPI0037D40F2F